MKVNDLSIDQLRALYRQRLNTVLDQGTIGKTVRPEDLFRGSDLWQLKMRLSQLGGLTLDDLAVVGEPGADAVGIGIPRMESGIPDRHLIAEWETAAGTWTAQGITAVTPSGRSVPVAAIKSPDHKTLFVAASQSFEEKPATQRDALEAIEPGMSALMAEDETGAVARGDWMARHAKYHSPAEEFLLPPTGAEIERAQEVAVPKVAKEVKPERSGEHHDVDIAAAHYAKENADLREWQQSKGMNMGAASPAPKGEDGEAWSKRWQAAREIEDTLGPPGQSRAHPRDHGEDEEQRRRDELNRDHGAGIER